MRCMRNYRSLRSLIPTDSHLRLELCGYYFLVHCLLLLARNISTEHGMLIRQGWSTVDLSILVAMNCLRYHFSNISKDGAYMRVACL